MILIPERNLVLVLVPRTGSGTLKRAVLARYPKAMLVYRHMEADGVPAGYDRWTKIGVVRHPVARLWSLYKFLRRPSEEVAETRSFRILKESVQRPFEDWLIHNQLPFQSPISIGDGSFRAQFMQLHSMPENRKSQFVYLRPDLGTRLWQFNDLFGLGEFLDVRLGRHNSTEESAVPTLSPEAQRYVETVFWWDLAAATEKML